MTSQEVQQYYSEVCLIIGCFNYDEFQVTDTAMKIETTGAAQIITGNKTTLVDVARFIEADAKLHHYPLKFKVSPLN